MKLYLSMNMRDKYHSSFFLAILSFLLCFTQVDLGAVIKEYDEVVSLGTACQAAWQLEANGMRQLAYPFDWVVTPFHALKAFLENKGENFLDKDKLVIAEVLNGSPSMLRVVDTTYDMHFIHDFLAPDMPNYAEVKAKYDRRVKRFFKLLETDKKILFIRVNILRHEAEYLDNFLHTSYPQLRYTLVALSEYSADQVDWGLPRIRNFYMPQTPGDWAGNHEQWKEILRQFSLRPTIKSRPPGEVW